MKIILVNDFGFPLGGAETYFFAVAEGLSRNGHHVIIVSSDRARDGRKFETDLQLGHCGHFFNLDSYFSPGNYFAFKKFLNKEKPDVIHLNNIFYTLSPSLLFSLSAHKTVMTLHDYYVICSRDKTLLDGAICTNAFGKCCSNGCAKTQGILAAQLKRKIIRAGLKNVTTFIAPSEYLKSEFVRNSYNNITVLPHPTFVSEVSDFQASDPNVILFLGRLEKQKGVQVLIEAAARVFSEDNAAVLKIAGKGSQERQLRGLAEDLGISDRVQFLGWVDDREKEELIKESLFLVHPALWPEVAGLSIYEAAAYGRATIASNIGSIPEFISDRENGLLFKHGDSDRLADAMLYLLQNKKDAAELGARAKTLSENRTVANYVKSLEEIYQ